MSTYQRDAKTNRCRKWEDGVWIDVPFDAPETTARKENEGMIVLPTSLLVDPDGQPVVPISGFLELLAPNPTPRTP